MSENVFNSLPAAPKVAYLSPKYLNDPELTTINLPPELQKWLGVKLRLPDTTQLGRAAGIMINAETINGQIAQPHHIGGEWVDWDTDNFFYHLMRLVNHGLLITADNFVKKFQAGWGWHAWGKRTNLAESFKAWRQQLWGEEQFVVGIVTRSGQIIDRASNESILPQIKPEYWQTYPYKFVIFTSEAGNEQIQKALPKEHSWQVEVVGAGEEVSASQILATLFNKYAASLISVEGGPALWTDFWQHNVIDCRLVTTVPTRFSEHGIDTFKGFVNQSRSELMFKLTGTDKYQDYSIRLLLTHLLK